MTTLIMAVSETVNHHKTLIGGLANGTVGGWHDILSYQKKLKNYFRNKSTTLYSHM